VTGDLTGDVTGNADTASALATARTIQLSGDVTGSVSFDGSGNVNMTTAVGDDSHSHVISNIDGLQQALLAKADDSTTITAGNGLTGGGTLGVNTTLTVGAGTGVTVNANDVAIGQDVATTANVTFNNITVTGTVDGRDVAADGTKLDGIEAGATGDQTASEIRALVESATDSNVFTDADHTKLNGIEANATADQTASEILTAIKTVDGSGSGLDADTLDGIQGSSFLRSDANDSMSGRLTLTNSNNDFMVYDGTSSTPYFRFKTTGTNNGNIQFTSSGIGYFWNDRADQGIRIISGLSGASWYSGGTYYPFWHSGNDGSGSGLDADTLDGVQGSSYLRSDAADTTTGKLTINTGTSTTGLDMSTNNSWADIRVIQNTTTTSGNNDGMYIGYGNSNSGSTRIMGGGATSGGISVNGSGVNDVYIANNKVWNAGNDGSGSGLDADTLDGVQGSSFLRSDTADTASGDITFSGGTGAITITGGSDIRSATGANTWTGEQHGKMQYHNDSWYIQYHSGFNIRNSTGNNRVYVDSSGNLTAHGNITAFSDIKLKKDIVTIENALDKINAMRGVYYTEIETDRARTGVIAQEVEKVLPEVVLEIEDCNPETGETDTTKAVDYGNMVGLLIEAIKEQQQQIDELKAKLEG